MLGNLSLMFRPIIKPYHLKVESRARVVEHRWMIAWVVPYIRCEQSGSINIGLLTDRTSSARKGWSIVSQADLQAMDSFLVLNQGIEYRVVVTFTWTVTSFHLTSNYPWCYLMRRMEKGVFLSTYFVGHHRAVGGAPTYYVNARARENKIQQSVVPLSWLKSLQL